MTSIEGTGTARLIGCLLGVTLAVALFVASRPASGGHAVGADVSFHTNLTGDLLVAPAGPVPFLRERALRPGESASGTFTLTNQSGDAMRIRMKALPSAAVLDELLQVELRSGDGSLVEGTLGALRVPGGTFVTLAPGESKAITASASLPQGVDPDRAAAALVEVAILFARHDSPAAAGRN